MKVTDFRPYKIINAYSIPVPFTKYDTIICTQALEYMDDIPKFLEQAKKVSHKLIVTAPPKGEMAKWSQLYIFDETNLKSILMQFGAIEVEDIKDDIMLYKLKFHD
jgi:ubiquinone/menaquinone biosynthesis C-methylase UbiE